MSTKAELAEKLGVDPDDHTKPELEGMIAELGSADAAPAEESEPPLKGRIERNKNH